MGKIDKAKEFIGLMKVFMGFLLAAIMGVVTSLIGRFDADAIDTTFWFGVVAVVILSIIFGLLVGFTLQKIDKLEEM